MKCVICNNDEFSCIHKGTRDIPNINVMKCKNCGMVQLDSNYYNTEEMYAIGGMLKKGYSTVTDSISDISWDTWIRESESDNDRRYNALKDICVGKKVLEFGCGNGGFLRRIKNVAASVVGIELMDEARERIAEEGINVYKNLNQIVGKYDVVCMFMVIEHLNEPDLMLRNLYGVLKPNGILICETPNSNDALISKYGCAAFEDFTYWSEHVMLFDSGTMETLMLRNGFKTELNTQIQRYPLSNHLYWLAKAKPGGHVKWEEFNQEMLNNSYANILREMGQCDTLFGIFRKD